MLILLTVCHTFLILSVNSEKTILHEFHRCTELSRTTLFYSTVPAKCKLPPLVSFLARRVSFLSRRVSFLSIRVSFLARVTEPFSMEYITRERSLYYLLYQGFPFALCCQIGEVEIKTESLFVFSFIVLNLQRLRTSV